MNEEPLRGGTANGVLPKIVLNVGCGPPFNQTLPSLFAGSEWRELRLDIDADADPDIVSSMTAMDAVESGSIDAIWSSHNLEHLHRHEVPLALGEFIRVLKPGGLLLLTLPDLQKLAKLVAADGLETEAYCAASGPITPLDMIFGHTTSLAQGYRYMAHKTGFTSSTLARVLFDAGFVQNRMGGCNSFDLLASALKPAAE